MSIATKPIVRIWINKDRDEWVVTIFPFKDEQFENYADLGADSAILAPFGESWWPSFDAAVAFVRQVEREGWLS